RRFWFRAAHLVAIVFIVVQSWLGQVCPLTIWENDLRRAAGDATYSGDFVGYWMQRLLYYDLNPWVFAVGYTVFGVVVLATFILGPPRRKKPGGAQAADSAS
ncbi:MAG: DUF2784 domain-containing protein, partial [Bacteroidetes bacterium]|nr:DUF2784 domain-containing protein [Bacteroidota bacterium]